MMVDEFTAIIWIKAQNGKGQPFFDLFYSPQILFLTAIISSQQVAISVKLRLWIKSPLKCPPSWLTKPTSKKPSLVLSHPLKVRTERLFFRKLSGRVVDLHLICCFFLMVANSWSMVAAEMVKGFSLTCFVKLISPCFSNAGINSARKGANRLE